MLLCQLCLEIKRHLLVEMNFMGLPYQSYRPGFTLEDCMHTYQDFCTYLYIGDSS